MLTDVLVVIALLLSGALTGFAAGLFGIGGGTILIPLMLTIFGHLHLAPTIEMHIAVATSLALIIPTGLISSYKHYRNGNLDLILSRRWIPGVCIGVLLGVLLIHMVSTLILKLFFTCYLIFCLIYAFFEKKHDGSNLEGPKSYIATLIGGVIGFFSTLLGVGGGTFTTPILGYCDYPIKHAVPISAITGAFIGVLATSIIILTSYTVPNLPPYSIGYVNWLVVALIAPTAILATPVGVNWGTHISSETLNKAYTLFIALVLLLMLYHLIFHQH